MTVVYYVNKCLSLKPGNLFKKEIITTAVYILSLVLLIQSKPRQNTIKLLTYFYLVSARYHSSDFIFNDFSY